VSLAQNGLPFVIIQFLKHGNVQICNSKVDVAADATALDYQLLSIRQNDGSLSLTVPDPEHSGRNGHLRQEHDM
jgi:hypothetical protein